jgi:hypothetical protein
VVDDDVGHVFAEGQLLNQSRLPQLQGGVNHVRLLINQHFSQDLLRHRQRRLQRPALIHKSRNVSEMRAAFVANSFHFFDRAAAGSPAAEKQPLLRVLVLCQDFDRVLLGLLHLRDSLRQRSHGVVRQLHDARAGPAHATQCLFVDQVLQSLRGN